MEQNTAQICCQEPIPGPELPISRYLGNTSCDFVLQLSNCRTKVELPVTIDPMSDRPPIACDPSAIDEAAHEEHREVSEALFEHITDLQELPDGYAFRLPTETEVVQTAGAFVSRERLCCPFFHFTLDVSSNDGPVWLEVRGRDGVKQYIEDAVLPYWDLEQRL